MNEEEAQRAIDLAKEAIRQSEWPKAERFLQKSMRMCESAEADHLMKLVRASLSSKSSTKQSS